MSIRPPTDIVLDVARAADPLAYKQAAARLTQVASVSSPVNAYGATEGADDFTSIFDQVTAPATPGPEMFEPPSDLIQMPFNAAEAVTKMKNRDLLASASMLSHAGDPGGFAARPMAASAAPGAKAYQSFEAMVLSSFVETMLPQNAESTFGTGTAGQIWRSMLAQQIATQMADAGGIGIARQLEAADIRAGKAPSASGLL